MDLKTLEYMEERAGKARKIVTRIEKLREFIVRSKNITCMTLNYGSHQIKITEWGKRAHEYSAEAEAHMVNVFIDITNKEIARLEKELAEL
ncbi:hypothetical protein [Paenibacillus sp. Pae108]|uniref:hypothetical protein n=1 Tax=Paenibacillus sp. Pae108 TaxID=2926019 RepID=UPI002119A2CA|nr:hypothetical protein [Paenibacillus sp. Pae108]